MTDVLVAVVGQSPEIVTETLWALRHLRHDAQGRSAPFVPAELHLVFTEEGQREVEGRLLARGGGLELYHRTYGPAPEPVLHPVLREDGGIVQDVRGEPDSVAVADTLARVVGELCAREDARVHVSMAGGRKTMSFYAGYALSLFGRPCDELSHVLVADPFFEQSENFWFPMPEEDFPDRASREVGYRDPERGWQGRDAATAELALTMVPFVRLRFHLEPTELLPIRTQGFAGIVAAVNEALQPKRMILRRSDRTVRIGRFRGRPLPQIYAMIELLADATRRRRAGAGPNGHGTGHHGWLTATDLQRRDSQAVTDYVAILRALYRDRRDDPFAGDTNRLPHPRVRSFEERLAAADPGRQGRSQEVTRQAMNKIFNPIKNHAAAFIERLIPDPMVRAPFEIRTVEEPAPSRFGFALPPHAIEIILE